MHELVSNAEQIEKSTTAIELPTTRIGSIVTFLLDDQIDKEVETYRITERSRRSPEDDGIHSLPADTFVAAHLLKNHAKEGDTFAVSDSDHDLIITVLSVKND